MKKMLLEEFSKRFCTIEQVSLLAIATILDPRFKNINFVDKIACAYAQNKLTRIINETIISSLENSDASATMVETDNNTTQETCFWSYDERLANISKKKFIEKQDNSQTADDLRYYLNQTVISINEYPIKYWTLHSESILSNIAKKYLAIISTSVPSERLFSKAGNSLTEARNRLSVKHLQQLLFLGSVDIEDWHL